MGDVQKSISICTTWYLLLEVANGVLVGICKEVENAVFDVVLLQVVHQMCSIALTSLGIKSGEKKKHRSYTSSHKNLNKTNSFLLISVYLDLLIGCDSTEDYFREALGGKHPETDAPYHTAIFNESQGLVLPVDIGREKRLNESVNKDIRPSDMQRTVMATYGSNTSRVMYSLGIRGSWWENTFWRPTSHIRIFLLDFWESEFPMTWNSMMPRLSSSLAVSSRAALGVSRFVW